MPFCYGARAAPANDAVSDPSCTMLTDALPRASSSHFGRSGTPITSGVTIRRTVSQGASMTRHAAAPATAPIRRRQRRADRLASPFRHDDEVNAARRLRHLDSRASHG
jgi:hypothetical protein